MSERCAAISDKGRTCFRPATVVARYHGAGEIHGHGSDWAEVGGPVWVRVPLCKKHGVAEAMRQAGQRFAKKFREAR